MVKTSVWGTIRDLGDGTYTVDFYMEQWHAQEVADENNNINDVFEVETFVDSNVFDQAAGNSEIILHKHNIRIL